MVKIDNWNNGTMAFDSLATCSGVTSCKRLHMKSSSYGDAVVASFKGLQQSDELADFTVKAQGKSMRVHKILLAAMSDYFRAMFLGPMKESKENNVDLKGLSADALQLIIDFLYSGEMDLDSDNLIDVLNASSHLQVETALQLCSDYMISLITFTNADELLNIADTYSLARVSEFYTQKVLQNFEDFCNTEQFLRLGANQLARFLAADGLCIRSEIGLYNCVAKWYEHDQTRKDQLDAVLRNVRFKLMSERDLAQIQQHWLTGQYLPAMKYISEGMKVHTDLNQGHTVGQGHTVAPEGRVRATEQSLVFVHQGSSYKPFEVTAYDHKTDQFYQLKTDSSGSRDCRVVSINNFIYICRVVDCGGGTLMNSLLRFDPRHLSLQDLTACRRLHIDPTVVRLGEWLYVFGGTNESYMTIDAVECYNTTTNTWTDSMPLPIPTHSLAGCAHGDNIYLSGGVGSDRQPTSSLICFNPANRTWQSKTPMQCARRLHEMLVIGQKLYIMGGIGGHTFHQQTQIPIECYDINTDQWTMLSSTLAGRSVGHFLMLKGKILSVGREHHEATEEEIWEYERDSDMWKTFTRVPRRSGLNSAYACLLYVNFYDEKICNKVITSQR